MAENDRISELSENLITQILSYLPTKDSVKTSVLSSRWKNLWLKVPGLDLNCSDFPRGNDQVFFSFVDRFLEFNPELRLQKLEVKCRSVQTDGLKDRFGTAVSRGLQHLVMKGYVIRIASNVIRIAGDVRTYPCIDFIPLNLYTCKTLVSLKLKYSGLQDPGLVSMPCLKFMHLKKIMWIGIMNMEKLISGCPVLEDLILLRDLIKNLEHKRMRSRSLKRFCVPDPINYGRPGVVYKMLEIDAPALEYLSIQEDICERIVVKNLSSLLSADLDIKEQLKE